MRKIICSASPKTKKSVEASTHDRIRDLEARRDEIDAQMNDPYLDQDVLESLWMERAELDDAIRFAWADDEAEWDYARNAQEFNPDGSLALYSSTSVECSDGVEENGKIQEGLVWDRNGHEYRVVELTVPGESCKVVERWISEDSGKEREEVRKWSIAEDPDLYEDDPVEFMYPAGQEATIYNRFYATSALNFEMDHEDYEDYLPDDDDYYTPSATRGDYSPSSPWNAPGMSIRDFI